MSMTGTTGAATALPVRSVPGSYGLPVLGPLKDRLDYFWFQGPDAFFRSRMAAHNSTVFRTNMPPTFPFFLGVDPHVVALLDCAAFSTLFDTSLVDKRNVLVGSYMPSVSFTGDTRVAVYLDPSEPTHAQVKSFCMDVLKRSAHVWLSEFISNLDIMLSGVEKDVSEKGSSSFLLPLQKCIFAFLCKSVTGADPATSPVIRDYGFAMLDKWLAFQLLPITKAGIPQPLEEIFLHSFPFPAFLVAGDYRKLYDFIKKEARETIQLAQDEYGLGEDEAINNILFVLGFNAFGGFSVFFPTLITTIGRDETGLQSKLREEVRRVVNGGNNNGSKELDFQTVKEMEMVRSTVYEVLRLNPPVPLQYARARSGFELRSHEAAYRVEKGELLCGYQPLAMRDPLVFEKPEEFVPDRFAGEGMELLKYLFWSNGPETGSPSTENKQCAAKDYVVATACLLVAELFKRYDSFECDGSMNITKLEKAS